MGKKEKSGSSLHYYTRGHRQRLFTLPTPNNSQQVSMLVDRLLVLINRTESLVLVLYDHTVVV